jgi:hypothetical protein
LPQAVLEQRPEFFNLLQLPEERVKIVMVVAVGAQDPLMEPVVVVVVVVVVVGLGLMVLGLAAEAVRVIRADLRHLLLLAVAVGGRKGRGGDQSLLVVLV